MKIRIKAGGIFGAQGEIPVGTEIEVKEAPIGWTGRYDVISDGPKRGSAPVNNSELPELSGKNKAELLKIAKVENVQIEDGATNADIVTAIELAREEAAKQ